MTQPSRLFVRSLTKTYDVSGRRITVLSGVDLVVYEGEFVSVIGRNASGKSTLLKIIAGVRGPTSGTLELIGVATYLPQDHALLPWRTVEENLLLPSDLQGVPRSAARKRVHDFLAEFGLERYARMYPAALSGGTRQKVALLRAVLQDASFLLLDEPFVSLDALTRLEAQAWLLALIEKTGASVLFVTHDIQEAIFLSDAIYVLNRSGHVSEKFSVPLLRPRRREHMQTPAALQLEKTLLSLLVPAV